MLLRIPSLSNLRWAFAVPVLTFGMLPQPAAPDAPPLSPPEKNALNDFAKQAKNYISMEHALPADKLKPTSDVNALEDKRKQLRQALQLAHPNAKQGDLFTSTVAPVFRKLLAFAMKGPDGSKIRASLAHAEPLAPANLTVYDVYPNTAGQPIQSVPASLLKNLPALPKGLEYAVAGHTLALRDTDANMVVDLLPDALP